MIVVTGATGNVGREVVAELLRAGQSVRAMTRRPAEARLPSGVEVVPGDLGDAASVTAALRGADRMFLFPPFGGADAAVAGARAAGVKRVVLLSSASVLDDARAAGNQLAEAHRRVERAVEAGGFACTFVRPGGFATNALAWAGSIRSQGVVRGPYPESTTSPIDPRDIGEVAARLLLEPHVVNVHPMLTGPESLTQAQQVEQIGQALGRPLRFETITREQAKAQFATTRIPPHMVETLLDLQASYVGAVAPLSPAVQEILGKPPRTFATWARDAIAAFR